MKPNLLGITSIVLAVTSLALPWWTANIGVNGPNIPGPYFDGSKQIALYPYLMRVSRDNNQDALDTVFQGHGLSIDIDLDMRFALTTMVLMIVGTAIAVAGNILSYGKRKLLMLGAAIVLLATITFAVWLQSFMSQKPLIPSFPSMNLVSNGSFSWIVPGYTGHYTTYLSFGFWVALASGAFMLGASKITYWPRPREHPLEKNEIKKLD